MIGNWASIIERVIGPVVVQEHYDMFNIMVEFSLNPVFNGLAVIEGDLKINNE